jgi:FkbM family methyltransferase
MSDALPQVTLSSGRTVFCLKPGQAKFNATEVPSYFEHSITVNDGAIVFDVGAHIGLFSLWVFDHFGPNVSIYAFEPVPAIFEVLAANVRELPPGVVKPLPFGLSKAAGTLDFSYFPAIPSMSAATDYRPDSWFTEMEDAYMRGQKDRGYPVLQWLPAPVRPALLNVWRKRVLRKRIGQLTSTKETVRCTLKTVSDVISEHRIPRIDLLKIDVEGSEMDVIAGIEDRDWPKVQQVVVELEACSRNGARLSQILRERGFRHIELEESGWQHLLDIGLLFARR